MTTRHWGGLPDGIHPRVNDSQGTPVRLHWGSFPITLIGGCPRACSQLQAIPRPWSVNETGQHVRHGIGRLVDIKVFSELLRGREATAPG